MTTKHTPGPWNYRESYTKGEPQLPVVYAGREIIAEIPGTSPHDLANARLIASAPELKNDLEQANRRLWQLCDMVNSYASKLGLGKKVNASDWVLVGSLAKAEGRE